MKKVYVIRSKNSITGLFYVERHDSREAAIKANGGKAVRRVIKTNGSVDTHSVGLFSV